MRRGHIFLFVGLLTTILVLPASVLTGAAQPAARVGGAVATPEQALLDRYCITCHNDRVRTAGLSLDTADLSDVGSDPEVWENVVRKLRGGVMPPVGRPRPEEAEYDRLASWLEMELDRVWADDPDPTQWVGWGQRSFDDMYHAHVNVTYLTDEDYEQIIADRRTRKRTDDNQ